MEPLRTARGTWSVREGFIIRVEENGFIGYGEVAPIPGFGTETVEAARVFLQELAENPFLEVPSDLPCCAFGLSSAHKAREALPPASTEALRDYKIAALLPAGRAALEVAKEKVGCGYEVFKWKIGVESVEEELGVLRDLLPLLPEHGKLRLDANGGLTGDQFEQWLAALSSSQKQIEYLEQPLSVGEELVMAAHASGSAIPIALDESLNGPNGAHWLKEWTGPLVVKPALMGDVDSLIQLLLPITERVILSSVFETQVGLENALTLADRLPGLNRAIGFDTLAAFDDDLHVLKSSPIIHAVSRGEFSPETIWKQLPHLI